MTMRVLRGHGHPHPHLCSELALGGPVFSGQWIAPLLLRLPEPVRSASSDKRVFHQAPPLLSSSARYSSSRNGQREPRESRILLGRSFSIVLRWTVQEVLNQHLVDLSVKIRQNLKKGGETVATCGRSSREGGTYFSSGTPLDTGYIGEFCAPGQQQLNLGTCILQWSLCKAATSHLPSGKTPQHLLKTATSLFNTATDWWCMACGEGSAAIRSA